jgi:tRNA pseudouridine38-40 synthase
MRIAAIVEYDGTAFCGWQYQDGVRTVQDEVEKAVSKVANSPVRIITAGRTDAGVHATGQVIHFDADVSRNNNAWLRGINSNLPADVAIHWVNQVDDNFHARFDATGRHYHYVILNRRTRPTFLAKKVTWDYRDLNVARMEVAAKHLVGEHDFSSFRAVACQAKSPVRDLRLLEVSARGDYIVLHVYANAFLHHMVRNLAGVLMTIGSGEQEPDWAKSVLAARDRTQGGLTAPPDGLYLTAVEYPESSGIPVLSPESPLW